MVKYDSVVPFLSTGGDIETNKFTYKFNLLFNKSVYLSWCCSTFIFDHNLFFSFDREGRQNDFFWWIKDVFFLRRMYIHSNMACLLCFWERVNGLLTECTFMTKIYQQVDEIYIGRIVSLSLLCLPNRYIYIEDNNYYKIKSQGYDKMNDFLLKISDELCVSVSGW